jgi:hypothetical protein
MTGYAALLCFSIAASAETDRDNVPPVDSDAQASYQSDTSAIAAQERLGWILKSTLGPKNLFSGIFISGWGTWRNQPVEYGSHWDGYAKRYGLRLSVGGTSNVIEAGVGSLWGEDPRYRRADGQPLGRRLTHVVVSTFVTHDRNGGPMPAYARYIAVPGGNLLSNAWRPDSQATLSNAAMRVGLGFLSRMAGNAYSEFFPDLRDRIFHKKHSVTTPPSASTEK